MKLNYILGRTSTGKSYELMRRIASDIDSDSVEKIVLIVPEQYTLHAEYELINKMNLNGLIKAEVLSFKRLAYMVLSNTNLKSSIDEIGKYMMLNKIMVNRDKDLKVFKNSSKKGVLSEILSLINHFKQNNILSEHIIEKLEKIENNTLFKNKLEDIAVIYESFQDNMEKNYLDDKDILNILISQIQKSDFFKDSNVYLDGFNSFSAQEYSIIEQLILNSNSLTIALMSSWGKRDSDLFKPVEDTLNSFKKIENEHEIKSDTMKLDKLREKTDELIHLEKELYSYPYNKWTKKPNDICSFSGINRNSEIESVAKRIITLVRDSNYRWRDILVVTSNIDIYQAIFKRVFAEYKIPYFLDETRDITSNGLIRYVISSLNTVARHYKYDDVFKTLKTGFSNLEEEEIELLENYALQFDIKGEKWFMPFDKKIDNIEQLEEIRIKYVNEISSFKDSLQNKENVEDINRAVFNLLISTNCKVKMDFLIEEQKANNRLDMANESAQIWNILIDVLEQMNRILGSNKSSLKDYIKNLEAGLMNYEIGVIPPSLDQIIVGNLERSRTRDIKAIFIVGVNDGILPSIISDSGLLSDEEKTEIKNLGFDIKLDSEKKIQDEKFLIYSAMTKPKEKLFLSYALSDNEGKVLRHSTLIDRLKILFPELKVKSELDENRSDLEDVTVPTATMKYMVTALRRFLDGDDISKIWLEAFSWYKSDLSYLQKIEDIVNSLFYTNQKEYLSKKLTKQLYSSSFKTSISRLENFIKCPFSHFVNYGLSPSERKDCKVKSPDVGNLFHNSIEKYSKTLEKENLDWNEVEKDQSEEILDGIIDEMVEDFQNGIFISSNRYKYLIKKLKRISKRAVWIASEHIREGEFNPLKHEVKFGKEDSDIPPIIISLPTGEELVLEGRIDRVDILETEEKSYVKVIDYKSGDKKFSLSDVYYGFQIQLVVYLDALLQNSRYLVKNELYPAGAFYFKIKDPMIETEESNAEQIENAIYRQLKMDGMILKDIEVIKLMDKSIGEGESSDIVPVRIKKDGNFYSDSPVYDIEEFNSLINHIHTLITEIGEEIYKGKVKIEPYKSGETVSCQFCDFSSICQFDIANDDNEYRSIKKLNNGEVMEKISCKRKEE